MKIKDGYILRKVAGEWIVVAIGPASASFNKMVRLNETSKFVWSLLENEINETQLVQSITDEYDVSEELASRDVKNIINQFTEIGCIEV